MSSDEIQLSLKTISIKNIQSPYEKQPTYFIRILEISDTSLKTLERFETDAWDSGFAKEKRYTRS